MSCENLEKGAPFSIAATSQAMIAAMNLMGNLGRETAEIWDYPYPIENQTKIQEWIEVSISAE
jgi:hypothetical protein